MPSEPRWHPPSRKLVAAGLAWLSVVVLLGIQTCGVWKLDRGLDGRNASDPAGDWREPWLLVERRLSVVEARLRELEERLDSASGSWASVEPLAVETAEPIPSAAAPVEERPAGAPVEAAEPSSPSGTDAAPIVEHDTAPETSEGGGSEGEALASLTEENRRLREALLARDRALSELLDAPRSGARARASFPGPAGTVPADAGEHPLEGDPRPTSAGLEPSRMQSLNELLAGSGLARLRFIAAEEVEPGRMRDIVAGVYSSRGVLVGSLVASECLIAPAEDGGVRLQFRGGALSEHGAREPFEGVYEVPVPEASLRDFAERGFLQGSGALASGGPAETARPPGDGVEGGGGAGDSPPRVRDAAEAPSGEGAELARALNELIAQAPTVGRRRIASMGPPGADGLRRIVMEVEGDDGRWLKSIAGERCRVKLDRQTGFVEFCIFEGTIRLPGDREVAIPEEGYRLLVPAADLGAWESVLDEIGQSSARRP